MKKLLSVLIASLLILSLCSCEKPAKNAVDTDEPVMSEDVVKENTQEKEDIKKQSEQVDKVPEEKDNEPKNDAAKVMEDAELLEELLGFYLPVRYVDTYKETKSGLEAAKHRLSMSFYRRADGGFGAMLSDLHQGGPEFGKIDSIVYEDGKYTLTTLPEKETGSLKMVYTPGSNVVQIDASEHPFWYKGESLVEFYKYKGIEAEYDIAKAIFEGINSVRFADNEVYVMVDGAEYTIEFTLDVVVTEPIDYMDECDGYVWLCPADSDESILGQYSYENGKLTIASEGIYAVLE